MPLFDQGLNALHHASQLANAELCTKCVMQLTNLDFEAESVNHHYPLVT